MKGMCHGLGARGREEIGRCQSRKEGWRHVAAGSSVSPEISRDLERVKGVSRSPLGLESRQDGAAASSQRPAATQRLFC